LTNSTLVIMDMHLPGGSGEVTDSIVLSEALKNLVMPDGGEAVVVVRDRITSRAYVYHGQDQASDSNEDFDATELQCLAMVQIRDSDMFDWLNIQAW